METIKIDISQTGLDTVIESLKTRTQQANSLLHSGKGAGGDYLGWVGLPSHSCPIMLSEIKKVAVELRKKAEVIISIGIGGSYLGAKAVIEALTDNFIDLRCEKSARVVFAGHNLSEDSTWELLDALKDRSIALVVVSKSGTTLEPAIAFRIFRAELVRRYGQEEAARRIAVVTDGDHGALKTIAAREGYMSFSIPDDVGGRFSVLSAAGLLPIACAGIDITELIDGAVSMERETGEDVAFADNPAAVYAAARNALYGRGLKIEILASYEPRLHSFGEWWRQLFGESEGKDGKGIFPTAADFTTDLHSLGQYIQQGERILFETVLSVSSSSREVRIPSDVVDADGLNYLSDRRLAEINQIVEEGVRMAHVDGGVPNIRITLPEITPYRIGSLIYFFEKACGISGYLLGVNPFDQPGVEAYKKNMFALLGKPVRKK